MSIILFLGTKIGYVALETLIELDAQIDLVFIDKEHSHEMEKYDERIAGLCHENGINVYVDAKFESIASITLGMHIDYIVCVGFRRLIGSEILDTARYAALSTHFSLLPKYRGFAPVNWAIINGEKECGVSLFHMEDGADSGDIVAQRRVTINEYDYANDVMDKCVIQFKEILKDEWPRLSEGLVTRIPQDESKATFTCARNPEDGEIDWKDTSVNIYNLIRGTSKPFPGAYTLYKGKKLIVWSAEPYDAGHYVGRIPGKVIKHINGEGVVVLTGDGALLIKEVRQVLNQDIDQGDITADQMIKSVRVTLGR